MENIEETLKDILTLNGAIAASIVDWSSGMVLGTEVNKEFDIELASAGNSEMVKAEMATIKSLGANNEIQDILITLNDQLHIIYIIESNPDLFIYIALDENANLALARNKAKNAAKTLII